MRKRLEAWLFADADGAPALIRRLVTENARAFAPLYALAFVCMGLVGHLELSSRVKLPRREAALAPSVEAQVDHVAARSLPYMRQAQEAGVPFVFIGHSIGAWIALHAERRMRAPEAASSRIRVVPPRPMR